MMTWWSLKLLMRAFLRVWSSSEKTSSRRMMGFSRSFSSTMSDSTNLRARMMERVSPREAEPSAGLPLKMNSKLSRWIPKEVWPM